MRLIILVGLFGWLVSTVEAFQLPKIDGLQSPCLTKNPFRGKSLKDSKRPCVSSRGTVKIAFPGRFVSTRVQMNAESDLTMDLSVMEQSILHPSELQAELNQVDLEQSIQDGLVILPQEQSNGLQNEAAGQQSTYNRECGVFIGRLPLTATSDVVESVIREKLGEDVPYESFRLVVSKVGVSRGFGYVNFSSKELSEKAVERLKGLEVAGTACHVDHASNPSKSTGAKDPLRDQVQQQAKRLREGTVGDSASLRSIFVNNIPPQLTDPMLRSIFESQTGVLVESITFMADKTAKDKRFAFLKLRREEDVAQALAIRSFLVLNKAGFKNETLEMKKANIRVYEYTVFIGNLPFSAGDSVVREMFEVMLGKDRFKRVYVAKDQFDRPRGFGFGVFNNPQDAKRAIEILNGMDLLGRIIRVEQGSTRIVRARASQIDFLPNPQNEISDAPKNILQAVEKKSVEKN